MDTQTLNAVSLKNRKKTLAQDLLSVSGPELWVTKALALPNSLVKHVSFFLCLITFYDRTLNLVVFKYFT